MEANSSTNFLGVKLIGEPDDLPCHPTRSNTVIRTKWNGFKMAENATWEDWDFAIVFPDRERAEYFVENFKPSMHDYREGMIDDDYHVHIIRFAYPKRTELYADQLRVSKGEFKRYE